MANFYDLLKKTNAYKMLSLDIKSERLSHAYLVLSSDKEYLREYLKTFAKLILCKDNDFCDTCRTCRLVNEERLTDLIIYPKVKGEKIAVSDANEIVNETFVKPYELIKKIFIIEDAVLMNGATQNKLLKTIEEPPENSIILIGASSEHAVLNTIKSRVKKLEIPLFSPEELYSVLEKECEEKDRLQKACYSYDGTIGGTLALYSDAKYLSAVSLAEEVLVDLKSSKNLLTVMEKITASNVDINLFLDALEVLFRDMMVYFNRERYIENAPRKAYFDNLDGFNSASALFALEKVTDAKKRKYFNNNDTMLLERLLLFVLEGKYKWKK